VGSHTALELKAEVRFLGNPDQYMVTIPTELFRLHNDLLGAELSLEIKGTSARQENPQTQCKTLVTVLKQGNRGPCSSVGIATSYGLDGPGIQSLSGRDFSHTSRPALGPTQPPVQWIPGVKRPGCGADHPPPSSAEVENG
jgi:hypothetical protein